MQSHATYLNPEQRQSGSGSWKAGLCITAAAVALPFFLFSGFEIGVEAAEYVSAKRARARSAWMAEYWGSQWAGVEREILERDGGADWLAQSVRNVDAPSWESVSAELRGSLVEELLAGRRRMCEGFVGERRSTLEQVQSTLVDDDLSKLAPNALLALVDVAQSFEAAIDTAASSAFDVVLELDDAIWSRGEFDRGLFYLPQCTTGIDSASNPGMVFMRAQTRGPWLVRYVVDCAEEPRFQAVHDVIRALQLERATALRAVADEWRTR